MLQGNRVTGIAITDDRIAAVLSDIQRPETADNPVDLNLVVAVAEPVIPPEIHNGVVAISHLEHEDIRAPTTV